MKSEVVTLFRNLRLAWPKTCARFIQDPAATYAICRRCRQSPRGHRVRQALKAFREIGVAR